MRAFAVSIGLLAMLAGLPSIARADTPGAQVELEKPAGHFIGKLTAMPDHGRVGTPVTVTGEGFPQNAEVDLIWRTVKGHWKTSGGTFQGREFLPVSYRIGAVRTDAGGGLSARFVVPEDFGGEHDIVVQRPGQLLTQTGFRLDMSMSLSPRNGAPGTPVTVDVTGIGWRDLENSWMLVYDNSFTGWVSSVTTGGSAHFTVPATGGEGAHTLRLVHGAFTFPYLNPEQNPVPDRARPEAVFNVTSGEAILPLPPEEQRQKSVRGLPAQTDLVVEPAFAGVGQILSVSATGLTPGETYGLNWETLKGNRVLNGWETHSAPVAQSRADENGHVSFDFPVPDDLGGEHKLRINGGGQRRDASFWITPTALPLDVAQGSEGTSLTLHLKGVGWSETGNIYTVVYDNAYLGYACGFNSHGDVVIHLPASGTPGWHFIDLYPAIYKGQETRPVNFLIPQLTYAMDHPNEDFPAFHFAFFLKSGMAKRD